MQSILFRAPNASSSSWQPPYNMQQDQSPTYSYPGIFKFELFSDIKSTACQKLMRVPDCQWSPKISGLPLHQHSSFLDQLPSPFHRDLATLNPQASPTNCHFLGQQICTEHCKWDLEGKGPPPTLSVNFDQPWLFSAP